MSHPERVQCRDGWGLAVEWFLPAAPPVAVAVLGHAMMVDRRTLDARGDGLASTLARAGVAVLCADLRGHGASGPGAAAGGRWSYDDLCDGDAPALFERAAARFPGVRRVAVGHSLFGHVALAAMGRHPASAPDALVMLAANLWLPRWEPDVRLRLVKRAVFEVTERIVARVGYLPVRRVRAGTADESAGYWRQMAGFMRDDAWSARDGSSYIEAARRVRAPVLAVVGAGDRLYCRETSMRRFCGDLVPHATVEVVGRASGLSFDPGHMALVTSAHARPLWERVARWVCEAR